MGEPLNKLFVYGIFLGASARDQFGLSNPQYATVKDYVTYGGAIVKAYKIVDKGLSLSGLICDVDPAEWGLLDILETGYDRIRVETTLGNAWMYVGKVK